MSQVFLGHGQHFDHERFTAPNNADDPHENGIERNSENVFSRSISSGPTSTWSLTSDS